MTEWLEDLVKHPITAIVALILTLAIFSAPCGVIAWIHYKWENVTSHSDSEPVYLKAGLRPIEETVIAAEQFDIAWRNGLRCIK